jgi:hypothetical protein
MVLALRAEGYGGELPVGSDAQLMLHTSTAKNPQLQLVNSKMRMVAVGVADTGPGLSEECCDLQSLASRRLTPRRRRTERTTPASVFHAHLRPRSPQHQAPPIHP